MGRKVIEIETREIDGIPVEGKTCCKCKAFKATSQYGKDKTRLTGLAPRCKQCESDNSRKYRTKNKDKVAEYNRSYYEDNKQYFADIQRRKRRENKAVYNLYKQTRRARKKKLPDTLTGEQLAQIEQRFGDRCALSGDRDYELDHFIALATDNGGTTYENMIPLSRKLNASKGDRNPFVWFERNKRRFNLSESRFVDLVDYLAEINGMSTDEYTQHVNACYGEEIKDCAFA